MPLGPTSDHSPASCPRMTHDDETKCAANQPGAAGWEWPPCPSWLPGARPSAEQPTAVRRMIMARPVMVAMIRLRPNAGQRANRGRSVRLRILTDAYSYADPGPVECRPEPGWTVHGEPLAARVRPSSLSISRIRSRSVTGPVCEIKAPGKAPGRAHVTCYGGRSPGERCADGERVDLPQFPEPGRVVVRGDLRVHRHHH